MAQPIPRSRRTGQLSSWRT